MLPFYLSICNKMVEEEREKEQQAMTGRGVYGQKDKVSLFNPKSILKS